MYNVVSQVNSLGADGKSAEIVTVSLLTIEPDTDNAGVGNFSFSLTVYSLAEFFYLEVKRMKTKSMKNVYCLVECAVFIALASVLSLIKVWQMPLDGSVTLVSMLPICIIAFRHGAKWGFLSSFLYSLVQLYFGITMSGLLGWGLTPAMLIGCIMFDYIIAFTVLGVPSLFRKMGERGFYIGIVLAFLLRFISHFLSGYIIFSQLEQWSAFGRTFENAPMLYSICYNGFYMLPELIITLIVTVILMRFSKVKKLILNKNS